MKKQRLIFPHDWRSKLHLSSVFVAIRVSVRSPSHWREFPAGMVASCWILRQSWFIRKANNKLSKWTTSCWFIWSENVRKGQHKTSINIPKRKVYCWFLPPGIAQKSNGSSVLNAECRPSWQVRAWPKMEHGIWDSLHVWWMLEQLQHGFQWVNMFKVPCLKLFQWFSDLVQNSPCISLQHWSGLGKHHHLRPFFVGPGSCCLYQWGFYFRIL